MEVRELTANDVALVCQHREDMFRDAGRSEEVLPVMTQHFCEWLTPRLLDGSYFGYVAYDQDKPIAGIGLMVIDWPPHPSHPVSDKRGYVLNVYIEPSHRRQGIARELMRLAEAEFARRNITFAILHATEKGRALYTSLGWNGTTEMSKTIATAKAA